MADVYCKGIKSDGSPCTQHVVDENGYCRHHRKQAPNYVPPSERNKPVETETKPETTQMQLTEQEAADLQKKRAAERRKASRDRRQRLGSLEGQRLGAEQRPGFKRRWVNDIGGRLDEMVAKGWDFVLDGDAAIENDDLGSRVSQQVSKNGDPVTAYLMECGEELYQEAQAEKEDRISEVEDQIRRAERGDGIGNTRTSDGSSAAYNPEKGRNALLE